MTAFSIILIIISVPFLMMGFGSLKDSSNYSEYGVESESLHKKFSWSFIVLGITLSCLGGFLLAG